MTSSILSGALAIWLSVFGQAPAPEGVAAAPALSIPEPGPQAAQAPAPVAGREFSAAIEDNSFFVEEAYNQERRVVQHIFGLYHCIRPERDTFFSFTQEWPFLGPDHQLSYTIPYTWMNGSSVSGVNDILINYRYQLLGEETWMALAPRFSLILPSGRAADGLGGGVIGVQIAMPASKRLSNDWVVHANLGWTFLRKAKGTMADGRAIRGDLSSYYGGGSLIYLADPVFNVMLECLVESNAEFDKAGRAVHKLEALISPGFRYALNLGHLQIVPGLAMPVTFSKGRPRLGVFVYLSFEHPY